MRRSSRGSKRARALRPQAAVCSMRARSTITPAGRWPLPGTCLASVVILCPNGHHWTWKLPGKTSRLALARLGPGDSMLAYLTEPKVPRSGGEVIVQSISGKVLARIPGAMGFAWNRQRVALAVSLGTDRGDQGWAATGLVVWDGSTGRKERFKVGAYDVAWLSPDRLIFDDWRRIAELDVKTGAIRESRHHGVLVSPDGRYSLLISPEGSQVLWDSQAKSDISKKILTVVDAIVFTHDLDVPPFWLPNRPHDLCIPVRARQEEIGAEDWSNTSGHRIAVIDVDLRKVVRTVPGKFLGPTSDDEGALVSVGREVRNVRLARD